jgi:multiple sugar transport system substrate-binding protein
MKKRIFFVSIAVCILALLSACGSSSSNDGTGEVSIQFWHQQVEQERKEVIGALIKEFEEQNAGIKVEQVPVPEEDFPTKISAALGANQLPALLEMGIDQSLFLGGEEVLETGLHEKIINGIGKDNFYTGALNKTMSPNGDGHYGVPVSGWVQGIWYREDLFKEKGLSAPNTWENILKAAKAFHDPDNKQYGIVLGTSKDAYAEQTFSQFANSNKATVFDQNGNVNFDSNEMVESLDYYKELAQYTPPGAETASDARDLFLAGNTPMIMYSSHIMKDLASKDLASVTKLAVPEKQQPSTFGEITSLAISNTVSDSEKDAAKKFIEFIMQKENNIEYLHMAPGGMSPTLISIAESSEYLENDVLKSFGNEAQNIASTIDNLQRFGFQDDVIYPEMGDISAKYIIGEALYNMTEAGHDPKKVAKEAQTKMESTVK